MMRIRNRRGATLVELAVTVVVMGIVGAALMQLLGKQSRFFSDQEGQANARRVARASINMLLSDLRMAEGDQGIVLATATTLTINRPFRMGVSCGLDAGLSRLYVAQQPVDSLIRAVAGLSGFAWVDTMGAPHYAPGTNFAVTNGSQCKLMGVDTIIGGRVIEITPALLGADPGLPVFSYEQVIYFFANSAAFPGARGLYRTIVSSGVTEEIAAPLDPSAQFRYFVVGSATPVSNPALGASLLGVDLSLTGLNDRWGITGGQTQQAPYETAIYFKNR